MQHVVARVSITMLVSGLSAIILEGGYPYRIATVHENRLHSSSQ